MPIYLRKGVYYVDIRTESGRRIRQSAGTKNKQEAQRLHNKLTYELWQHEHFDEKPKRLWEEAAVKWIEENGSKKSIGNDLCRLRGLPELRGIYLHHLTRDFIMDTVAKKNCSDSTKNRYLALIRAILNKAVKEWGWLERAPHLTLYREPKRRIRWLTKDEANRLIASLPDYMAEMVIFSLCTGLRQRNVLDLEWRQVDLTGRTAWIHPDESKSGKAIGVALNDTAIGVISRQMGKHSRFVFTYSNGRKVQSISSRIWKNALEKAGISDFRWHDLRHTWASWLVQSGVPLSALQEMGGWESVEMVRRYAHLSAEHLQTHAEVLDGIGLCKDTNWTQCRLEKNAQLTQVVDLIGGSGGVRTHDQGIMSPLL